MAFPSFRPTVATVDLGAITHNFHTLRARLPAGTRVLCPVKGDAYGHGAPQVARALASAGCEWFGVATVEEGLQLRSNRIEAPILLLSGAGLRGSDAAIASKLTSVLFDVASAKRLNAAAKRASRVVPVHLKVDTGMGRLGIRPEGWVDFVNAVGAQDNLHIDGVLTHLASADTDPTATATQMALFEEAVRAVRELGHHPTLIHADNSAGVLAYAHKLDLVRPGIALYGGSPGAAAESTDLRPALSVHTQVLSVKDIPAGTPISYGGTWVSEEPSRMAILPIGYADGYPRALSNRASVLINGQRAPLRGRGCMDLIVVDITQISGPVSEGSPVVLLGGQADAFIGADELASQAGTISYEVMSALTARIPRRWIQP